MTLDFPSDDFRPDRQQLFSCQILRNLLINERRCCNSVNKSSLQFSGHTFIYKHSVGDLTLAQFLKHVDCKTVRIFAYSSTREQSNKRSGMRPKTESGTGERWRFQKKQNRCNTNTGARQDRMVRFILSELFDT